MAPSSAVKYAPIQVVEVNQAGTQQTIKRGWKGWRRSTALFALASLVAFLANVATLIWASRQKRIQDNTVLVYQGSERKMKDLNAGLHAVITGLSSLLLAGGNACMQVMMAPSRKDIDDAHSKGHWLDIGVSGLRNLFTIPVKRTFIWLVVALTTVPLHLL